MTFNDYLKITVCSRCEQHFVKTSPGVYTCGCRNLDRDTLLSIFKIGQEQSSWIRIN